MTVFFLQMLAIVAIFYFLIIRPKVQQEKKHKERLSQIKKGDQVLTVGGIIGKVVHMKEDQMTIESGGSRIVVHRDRIADILSSGTEAK